MSRQRQYVHVHRQRQHVHVHSKYFLKQCIIVCFGKSPHLYKVFFLLLNDLSVNEDEAFYAVAAGKATSGLLSVPLQTVCILNDAL